MQQNINLLSFLSQPVTTFVFFVFFLMKGYKQIYVWIYQEHIFHSNLLNSAGFLKELNRRLRASVEAFFSHLCEVVQPCLSGGGLTGDKAQIFLTRQDNGNISVRLKSELAELPFYWEFHCSPAPVALVCFTCCSGTFEETRLFLNQSVRLRRVLSWCAPCW